MRGNLYAVKIVRSGIFFAAAASIGFSAFLQCTRDNPFDPGSNEHIPGTAPIAGFAADTIKVLATDSVQITVSFIDTEAYGGKTPAVTRLYFNWNGAVDSLTDSITVTTASPVIISRTFNLARNVLAYVRARDNDGMLGPAGSVRLMVTAGALPGADFIADSSLGFIRDSISMTVSWNDTQALGGKVPAVTALYLYWAGDSSLAVTPEIVPVSGAGPLTFTRVFTASRNTMVYVRALDNDLNIGPASGMRLIIDEGKPRITVRPAVLPPDSVLTGDSVTVTVTASDTNGVVTDYIWTVLGSDITAADSVLRYAFPPSAAGMQTIYVRVIDDDGAVSARDSVTIRVVARIDITGPTIAWVSPSNNATVTAQPISVILHAADPSGVLFVNVNSGTATRISGTDLSGDYQRDNVPLAEGMNVIIVQSMDTRYNQRWDTLRVTYQKPDYTPPSIVFSYPAPGDTVHQSPVGVIVTVTDLSGVAWVTCGVDTMANPSGNSYTASVVLVEGVNSLVITARDTRGNTAIDTLVFSLVILDKTRPVVAIVAPLEGALVVADSIDVSVHASDTGANASGIASVTVNGLPAAYNGMALAYERKIFLAHGSNVIIAAATDGSAAHNTAADTVTVVHNAAPHFVPDTSVRDTGMWVDSTVFIILAGIDPDSDPLVFSFVTNPARASFYGMVKTGNSATITYTAAAAGLDTFRVRVADSVYGQADTILVRVTNTVPDITPPAIAFTAPQPGDTVHQTPVTIVVSVTDPSGVAWVKCGSDTMVYVSGNSYSRSVTLTAEGQLSFVISAADTKANVKIDTLAITYLVIRDTTDPVVQVISPLAGQRIMPNTVQVTVAASDTGGVRSGIDSVTVNGVPAAFSAGNYTAVVALAHGYDTIRAMSVDSSGNRSRDSVIVLQNSAPAFNVSVRDTSLWLDSMSVIPFDANDADGDALTFSLITLPLHNSATPSMVSDGPDSAHLEGYRPNAVGIDTFRIKVTDSWGGADTLKVSVTVIDKGSLAPYFTISNPPDTAIIDSLYSVQLTAIDPGSLSLTYSLISPPTPSGVSISLAGLVTWTPSALGPNTIIAVVTNTLALSDTLQWPLHIVLKDYPPVLADPGRKTVNEGSALTFTLSATDTNSDPLVYRFGSAAPAGATLDSASGLFSWTPAYNQSGSYVIAFTAKERYRSPSLADTVTDTIVVLNVNRPPVLTNPGSRTVYEKSAVSFYLYASDPDNDSITYSMTGAPSGASLVNGSNFIWTPTGHQNGVYAIKFYAADKGSPVMRDSVIDTITVLDNTFPVFDAHKLLDTAWVGIQYSTPVHAVDADSDGVFYVKDTAVPAGVVVNRATGVLTWTPASYNAGNSYAMRAFASDSSGNLDTVTWTVRVLVPDYPPVLLNPGTMTVNERQDLLRTLTATDANGDTLRYSFGSTYPAGATIDSVTGIFQWTPTYKQAGVYTVVFKVTERGRVPALADSVTDTITVVNVNNPPVFVYPPDNANFGTYEKALLKITLSATDINGDSLTYSMINAPTGATISNTNLFTWTPDHTQGGPTYSLSFVASDTGTPAMADTVPVTIAVRDTVIPVFTTVISLDTAYVMVPYSLTVHAVDADSDAITYSLLDGPRYMTIDSRYGIISWTPETSYNDTIMPIRVIAADHAGNQDTLAYSLHVFLRWPRTYGSPTLSDTGFSVILTSAGTYAVCGTVGDSAFFLLTDTSGTARYYRKYGAVRSRWSANCIREVTGDGYIICGTDSSILLGTEQLLLIRIDGKGALYYMNHFLPEKAVSSRGSSVTLTADGMFAACGTAIFSATGSGLGSAMCVVKTPDAAGSSVVWEKVYYTGQVTNTAFSRGRDIRMTSDNGFIVTGEIQQAVLTVGTGIFTVKTSPIGDTLWTNVYHFTSGLGLRNYGAAVMESTLGMEDGYYVSGSFTTSSTMYGMVLKLSYKGEYTWYYTAATAMGTGIRATADGGCIASMCLGTTPAQAPHLIKLTTAGALMWRRSYAIATNGGAYDVAKLAGNTGYVLTGFTVVAGAPVQNNVLLVRTDVSGVVVK
jgi:hypothetical protein